MRGIKVRKSHVKSSIIEKTGGIQYTYQTAEGDADILEYYETWDEENFSEMYRGGASLSRIK